MGSISDMVQFKGLDILNDEEREFLNKIVPEYYEKLKRSLKNITMLEIHFKEYGSTTPEKRRKFDIHIRAIFPSKKIFASTKPATHIKNKDWKFSKSLQEAFKNLENQVRKEFHNDKSHPLPRD